MLAAFTLFHVLISLAGIGSGLVVCFGMLKGRLSDGWIRLFLVTTVATSVTGFLFPFHKFLPSHVVGILSLIALALAIRARRVHVGWSRTFVVTSFIALYFNVFVLVVQLFDKVPALKALAPTQSEAPFVIAQLAVLTAFVIAGVKAARTASIDVSPAPAANAKRAAAAN